MPDATASNPTTDTDATRSVVRIQIGGPIEAVWEEITRTDDVIPCFFNMRMHYQNLAPGEKMSMRSKDGKHTGVVGEILEVDPPRRFAHTFRFTKGDEPPVRVIYDLREHDGGTEFTITLEDLVPGSKMAKEMIGGYKLITSTLKSCIETGKPSLGVRMLFVVFSLTAPLTPKRCRTEHWREWGG
ncbi:MAG: SRPBCC domain-containing protein [Planctomycetota bacterium]